MRAAQYARVSTLDQKTVPQQLEDLRKEAIRRGWNVTLEIEETESGTNDRRPKRLELIRKAQAGRIDAIMVWRLDRWGRSAGDMILNLKELHVRGVAFVSLSENFDLSSPAGRAMAGMLSVFAEYERDIIVQRVRAGVKAYREKNGKWGRPRIDEKTEEKVLAIQETGKNVSEISRETGISRASVLRVLRRHSRIA